MIDLLRDLLRFGSQVVLVYFTLLNTGYLLLVLLGSTGLVRAARAAGLAETSPLHQPVSILLPVRNEPAKVVESVRTMLALHYPRFEVVVIDDGSTDATFERLRREYDLVEVPRVVPNEVPVLGAVGSVHVPRLRREPLLVVRKDRGGQADAFNAGLNLAQHPLVCLADTSCVPDPRALLWAAKPFADDPLRAAAGGGMIRVVPKAGRWLPAIQVVEQVRAFLFARAGWSRVGGLAVTSGAFGVFRRDAVISAGGLVCESENPELVVRLHHKLRDDETPHRVTFVGEPVAWREAPTRWRTLRKQLNRRHRGLAETLALHRKMLCDPHYRQVGLLTLPFFLLFELLTPIMEVAGLVLVPAGFVSGTVDLDFVVRFFLLCYGYATVVTLLALLADELAFHRLNGVRDITASALAAFFENIGYRQIMALARLRGLCAAVRQKPWKRLA
ncbi:MAG TPA: glycosyltransferase family 2 protein [Amycolatopsis sp.]|uniref:glycosyltransferase family 2 protein n=1 Tax=Amycolatopsis sp. TaxID=37632 RepID=UPI002B470A9D|nr:glycosyltransferase family 2 protein [Amycolatopsis sp.]HKS45306.1 glycosyltransferase family 2 protein [Amycolatopsis sp.]